jgi:hypothetical protein
MYACILILLVRNTRRGVRDARLLLAPVALLLLSESYSNVMHAIISTGRARFGFNDVRWFRDLTDWPFPIIPSDLVSLLMSHRA